MSEKDKKDQVFSRPLSEVRAFELNQTVANLFQDMISPSVPGYFNFVSYLAIKA